MEILFAVLFLSVLSVLMWRVLPASWALAWCLGLAVGLVAVLAGVPVAFAQDVPVESVGAIGWLMAHYGDIAAIGIALIGVATLIAKLTPTPKDDEAIGRIRAVIESLALGRKR